MRVVIHFFQILNLSDNGHFWGLNLRIVSHYGQVSVKSEPSFIAPLREGGIFGAALCQAPGGERESERFLRVFPYKQKAEVLSIDFCFH